ncbi:hypothetical protein CFP75_23770 [Amycolatopsis alba DSM 44262]|uniref:ParB/Sulfiredoxin domain-containing protein n=1 Tax=Amycolatopsis alba DSM 44262 TaxID=1125972 RepID=A0A229RLS4_AMYAL|nr:hypothetical protein CFP75_23770 [Amycolatopsis alba DSM 44262]
MEIPAQRDEDNGQADEAMTMSSDVVGPETVDFDESSCTEALTEEELRVRRAEREAEYDTIVYCDPADVVIGVNVRTENADTDPTTVQDMTQRGVDMAVKGYRDDDGTVVITMGQRRVLNAREAQCEVPVWIQAPPSDDERKATIDRIIGQVNENDLRVGLTLGDRYSAFQQLVAFDLKPAGIARKLGRGKGGKAYVENVLQAGASDLARAATERYDLTLDQAAVVAEFEARGDLVNAKELIRLAVAEPNNFQVFADVQRRKHAEAERVRALTEQLTRELVDAKVTILDDTIDADTGPARSLDRLRLTPDSEPGSEITIEQHSSCPGHAAWLYEDYQEGRTVIAARYGCADFLEHDHALSEAPAGRSDFTPYATDDEDEADVAAFDVARAAHAAAEWQRRANSIRYNWVRDSNEKWDGSSEKRHKWLAGFAAKSAALKGAQVFLATQKLKGGRALRRSMERNHKLANTLLKTGDSGRRPLAELISTAKAAKATRYDVFLTLCAMEEDLHRDAWRTPYPENQEYLTALKGWGYEASSIELRVLKPERVEDVITEKLGPDPEAEDEDVSNGRDGEDSETTRTAAAGGGDDDGDSDSDDEVVDPSAIELSADVADSPPAPSTEDSESADGEATA